MLSVQYEKIFLTIDRLTAVIPQKEAFKTICEIADALTFACETTLSDASGSPVVEDEENFVRVRRENGMTYLFVGESRFAVDPWEAASELSEDLVKQIWGLSNVCGNNNDVQIRRSLLRRAKMLRSASSHSYEPHLSLPNQPKN